MATGHQDLNVDDDGDDLGAIKKVLDLDSREQHLQFCLLIEKFAGSISFPEMESNLQHLKNVSRFCLSAARGKDKEAHFLFLLVVCKALPFHFLREIL